MTDSPELVSDKPERSSWELEEGDEAVPGLYALKNLGGGTHYEAYLVWADDLAYMLVAKMLRPDYATDKHAIESLRREAAMVARLNHPIIVRGFDSFPGGDRPYLLLEFLEGPNLSSLLRHGPTPVEQLLPLGLNLCSALHYLERNRVVHLDVKPRNIIMGVPPRLIDLSVARSFERAKKISGHIGTDAYMAPEQCAPGERGVIGAPADVWGLGATLYRAAAKRLPFPQKPDADESKLEERFPQLLGPPPPLNVDVPPAFEEAVMACLRADPPERPTAMEVADMLQPLVAELPRKPVLRRARPSLGWRRK